MDFFCRHQKEMSTSVYVLHLQGGRKYIGVSQDPEKALQSHKEGTGCAWTQMYPPEFIECVHSPVHESDLDQYVLHYMDRYGVQHVRGGSWSTVLFTEKDREDLQQRVNGGTSCVLQ
jgi:hypothetical protein